MRKPVHSPYNIAVIRHTLAALFLLAPVLIHAQSADEQACTTQFSNCFISDDGLPLLAAGAYAPPSPAVHPRMATMHLRAAHGGPLAHHWLEIESSRGKVTIGFGPAIIPFIDFGQIAVRDEQGNTQRVPSLHLFSINYGYAKKPGQGRPIGKPIQLTEDQADEIVDQVRHRRFFMPYVPLFHDCRTFACVAQSSARGKSTLPCYFLFKGYW